MYSWITHTLAKQSVFIKSFIWKKGIISSNAQLNCALLAPKYERAVFGQSSERNMHKELQNFGNDWKTSVKGP